MNVDRAVVSAAPLTAGQERLLAFAVGFETGPKLVSAKTKGRISIRVEVNEDKLVRALIRDGFLRQFQALDGDRAAIERAAGRAIDLWAAYSKTD